MNDRSKGLHHAQRRRSEPVPTPELAASKVALWHTPTIIQLARDAQTTTPCAQTMIKTSLQHAEVCASTRARLLGLMTDALTHTQITQNDPRVAAVLRHP
jgi:hypothetical protein